MQESAGRKFLNSAEVATQIHKSRNWVQLNHKARGIPSVKIGNQYFFRQDELDEWIEGNRVTLPPSAKPVLGKIHLPRKAS